MPGLIISLSIFIIGICLMLLPINFNRRILLLLAVLLFTYKLTEYTMYGLMLLPYKVPLEYSTMTYFIFSITIIFGIQKLKTFAAFSSLISGLGYLISFVLMKDQYLLNNGAYLTWLALINHSILFIGSLLMMKTHHYQHNDRRFMLNFTLIYLLYVIVMNYLVDFPQPFIFIRLLLDGTILRTMFPQSVYSGFDYLLYFLVLLLAYQLIMFIFYGINHFIYYLRKDPYHEYTV